VPRVSRARVNGGQTPADAELAIDAADAAVKMRIKRDEVYEMFKPIITKLKKNDTPERGKLITDCYDLQRHKPRQEYQDLIDEVKKEFEDCGLQWE
jgi:hypothetical protein